MGNFTSMCEESRELIPQEEPDLQKERPLDSFTEQMMGEELRPGTGKREFLSMELAAMPSCRKGHIQPDVKISRIPF